MVKQHSLIFILVLSMSISVLSAGTPIHDGYGLSLETGWYGSIPSAFHQDPLPLRTHFTFGGSISPVIMSLGGKTEISAGISAHYVTHSLIYGATVWRPFFAIGPFLNFTFHIDDYFSFSPGLTLFAGFYTQTAEFTPILRLSVTPGYTLSTKLKRNQWVITLPISVDLRTDYIAVSTGIGIAWRIDKKNQERL